MRENKSGPNRWTTEKLEAAESVPPKLGDGRGTSRSAVEELRKYPFFFSDDDVDEPMNTPPSRAARAAMERGATTPPLPTPPTEIRPLLAYTSEREVRAEVTNTVAEAVQEPPIPAASVSLAERHAAAIARKQHMPPAPPIPTVVPVETAADQEAVASTPRAPQAAQPSQEPWYSRVPTGVSLVAVIVYFLIGGVALIGTGLVLGGPGGALMALFGLAVTSVAAFVAWQALAS